MLEKIDKYFIGVCIVAAEVFGFCRRHPKFVLIWVMIAYATVCFFHVWLYSGNEPFFSLSAIISLFVVTPLIILYKDEDEPREGRRHPILETSNDWFTEIEQH